MVKKPRRFAETNLERDIRCGYVQAPPAVSGFPAKVVLAWWLAFWTALPLHAFNRWHRR